MILHTLLSIRPAVFFFPILVLVLSSCTSPEPYYQAARAPGGGYYASQDVGIHWGLVKRHKKISWPRLFQQPQARENPQSFWRGEGVSGRARITINLTEQIAYFYKGDHLVGSSPVCTGSAQHPTPTGSFSVTEKDADHYSSVYGDWVGKSGQVLQSQIDNRKDPRPPGAHFDAAKMFWFMRVVGGVGMHEGYLPGYADSHGCIRLPSNMARIYYQNAPLGTPVKIIK